MCGKQPKAAHVYLFSKIDATLNSKTFKRTKILKNKTHTQETAENKNRKKILSCLIHILYYIIILHARNYCDGHITVVHMPYLPEKCAQKLT
jgi:hypothetical protein